MGKPTGYTIMLMRTGSTDWDSSGRLIGRTDLPMDAEGESKFSQAVQELGPQFQPSMILTSSEESCVKGAMMLNFGRSGKIRQLDGLVNVGLGLWEGELANQLEDRCKSAYREWIDAPMRITPPQGEMLTDAQDRLVGTIVKGLKKIKGEHPVVGIVLRPLAWAVVRAWLLDLNLDQVWEMIEEPIRVEPIELDRDRTESITKQIRASA